MLPLDRSQDIPVCLRGEISNSSSTGVLAGISLLASSRPPTRLHDCPPVSNARRPVYALLENSEAIVYPDNSFDIDHDLQPVQKKRRLTNEQVKSLEVSYEIESKLEPDRKNHLAHELGLQPRQVAVWFQNRRARCKTKHLEREYDILQEQYDAVRLETDKLVAEVARLRKLIDTHAASVSGFRSADWKHESSLIMPQIPSEGQLQQFHAIMQPENPTPSRDHYQRCLRMQSDCMTSKQVNHQGEVDNSSNLEQTESVDVMMRSPKDKYVSQKYHQHAEAKLLLADNRCSSQLLQHMAVEVEENFDLYNEILHTIEDQAGESAALCFNWQRDA